MAEMRFRLRPALLFACTFALLSSEIERVFASEPDRLQLGPVVPPPQGGRDLCKRLPELCLTGRQDAVAPEQIWEKISELNVAVNNLYPSRSDQERHRKMDHWQPINKSGGDCEDYALRKKLELLELGLTSGSLRIVTVLDRNLVGHVVLMVQTAQTDMILDNLTDEILPWRKTGYVFLRAEDGQKPGQWRMAIGHASLEHV
jgi:predicted transglutaminase-like cysteine proteinase